MLVTGALVSAEVRCRQARLRAGLGHASSISDELGWTASTSAHAPIGQGLDREYFLRKAALLDRVALAEADGPDDITRAAAEAAGLLMELDDAGVICDPRAYVRQQYAHWVTRC
ncbi:hypothetical protein [Streptomyces sp. NPDC046805]|uniref:hypothetical protein n=1 Tax=Streptomyces sp. NPDC046805 TaxID=3155134 RepID=UPI003404F61B